MNYFNLQMKREDQQLSESILTRGVGVGIDVN